MKEELDVIVYMVDLVCFILLEVLILCAKEKHWDIHWMVVQRVETQNERDRDEKLGVMKFFPRFLLCLLYFVYQFIHQEQ